MKIEETIYTDALPVNTFPVLDRIKELLNEFGTNNIGDLSCYLEVRECMWLLNSQFRNNEFTCETHKEWLYLKEVRDQMPKAVFGVKVSKDG